MSYFYFEDADEKIIHKETHKENLLCAMQRAMSFMDGIFVSVF